MWQRIQNLYLLISAGLVAALCFGTAYKVASPEGFLSVSYWQIESPYFGILLGLVAFLILLALVVYKSRILQMRLAVLSGIMALGMQLWLTYMYFTLEGPVFRWTVIFPLLICISNMLAARGDFQDQLMVESAYRVRERRKRNKKK